MGGEQASVIESGSGAGGGFAVPRPVVRGAGLGCAFAGFGLLVVAQLLPWISITTTPLQQDFPTAAGGRLERGLDELPVGTEIFKLGWLLVLAAVATALVVRASVRRTAVAAGLGLVAGQLAMLAGITSALTRSGVFGGNLAPASVPVQLEPGLYCAYAALALFALALLFAAGLPPWLRGRVVDAPAATGYEPVDLTVSAVPTADPTVWSRAPSDQPQADIEVGGRQSER